MPTLEILVLSDGRPGHVNLADGIAAAIERLQLARTRRHEVRRGKWPGATLAAMTRARLPARTMLKAVYAIDETSVPPCDIVVSAGAETLAASIWLARLRGVPNIFYGSLRLFSPTDFALVLTSYARNATRPNHALALKPSRMDPDQLRRPDPEDGTHRTIAVLIGGDAGPIRYTDADWQDLIDLPTAPGQAGVRWVVGNSRRTPDRISQALLEASRQPGSPIASFLDARTAPTGTLPELLRQASIVVCTADSSSMLSESIWAQRPTIAVAPDHCTYSPDEADYRAWLASHGWCCQLSLRGLTASRVEQAAAGLVPLATNPQVELGRLLQQRIAGLGRSLKPGPTEVSGKPHPLV